MAESNLKGTPIEERSVLIGDMIIINGYCVNKILLKQRFSEGGYQCQETDHFLLFTRTKAPSTIIVHWFTPDRIDADIKHHIMRELKPIGVLSQPPRFGEIIAGIVGSYFPSDVRKAWRFFGANTLQRLLNIFINSIYTPSP